MDYNYHWLSGLDAASSCQYEDLTHPSITHHWQATQQYGELLGIAAKLADQIVGLAIAELDTQSAKAGILSLFVLPEHRGRGIGTHLVQQIETELVTKGCTQVRLSYQVTEITQAALEPILQRRGIVLMAESFQRQYDSAIPYYAYAVSSRNPPMLEFVDRHLKPYMSWIASL